MSKKKLTEQELDAIEEQISKESIPYLYDTKEYPIEVIISKYKKDQIFVPHYQRKFVWDNKRKSKFIESVFLGVPIMPFLVSISGEEAELEIIDGSQRIRTLVEYCDGDLKLSGLEKLTTLNGTYFKNLTTTRKNKFLLRDFRFHVVTEKATPDVRADIFNRINTTPKNLSSPEIRKGALQGDFYSFILECSQLEDFRTICPIPKPKVDRGEYEELILRFFAYSESYLEFKHDVTPFLDQFVKEKNTIGFSKEALTKQLTDTISFIKNNFDPPYCARKGRDNATPRVRFEALSVGTYLALKQNPNLTPIYMDWLYSLEFKQHTTTDASNNQGKLKARIEFVRDCLLNIITNESLHYE